MLWELFRTFVFIGFFNFGGGYAMIPLIQKEVVIDHLWLTMGQFTDLVAVAQSTPGPLAVNTATYVGYLTSGILGAALATLGLMLPAFILIISLATILMRNQDKPLLQSALCGLRPIIVALIASSAISLGIGNITDLRGTLLAAIAFVLATFTKVNPVFLILGFGFLGILIG